MSLSAFQLLNNCHSLKSLKCIHARLLVDGSFPYSDLTLNRILRLYSRFGAIDLARKVFDEIAQPNCFLWTALIHGHVENHLYSQALSLFCRMRSESAAPINFSLSSVIKALSRNERLKEGEAIYGVVLKSGFEFDLIVQNAVLDLFMRCQKADFARRVFDDMDGRDIVSWNSMISGYGNNGRVHVARELFDKMPERNVISWTSMICGYIKVGNIVEARSLFEAMPTKDLASWNVMVSGYVDACDIVNAQLIFDRMPIRDIGTWNVMISGFCKAGDMNSAEVLFDQMQKRTITSWTIMVDGYIKAGNIDRARSLFDQMPEKNLVTWSAMIGGYAKHGQPCAALYLLEQFEKQDIKPDETFILGIISACSQLGILETAESTIGKFLEPSHFSNIQLVTGLIDMYAKCGNIGKAIEVFEMTYQKDLLCYSTMISAFANHGLGQEAVFLFEKMLKKKIVPDGIIFLAILSSCNHGGLVNEGRSYFKRMIEEFKIQPSEKHYACMVDLLGRAGCLEDAYSLISDMHTAPSSAVWGALLAACRTHSNVELAEIAAAELLKIEPDNSSNYVTLSNVYAAARRWGEVAKVRAIIRGHRMRKNRGSSWIGLDCMVHEFVMSDISHGNSDAIYLMLDLLMKDMKLLGYIVVDLEQTNYAAECCGR